MPELTAAVRNHRLDAAKGILIVLVVLGHLLEATAGWDARSTRLPLTGIYMFHMPAFVFLAGVTANPVKLPRRIGTHLILLVVFQVLYFIAVQVLGLERDFSPFAPFWILWFLLAMCWWQLLMPFIARYPKASLTVSVLVASTSGTIEAIGYPFSLSRALVFLPFFVLGATYGKVILRAAPKVALGWKLIVLAVLIVVWLYLYSRDLHRGWLYGSYSFERLDVADAPGILVRVGLLCVATLATFVLLSLMPAGNSVLALLGRRSLAIYLMHGFVALGLSLYLPGLLEQGGNVLAVLACLVAAVLTAALFAVPVFDKAIRGLSGGAINLLALPFSSADTRRLQRKQ